MDTLIVLEEKCRKKKLHPARIHLLSESKRRIFEASDWVESLKVCLSEIAKGLDKGAEKLSALSEGIDREGSVEQIRSTVLDTTNDFLSLTTEYARILAIYGRPLSSKARKHVDDEMTAYWEKVQKSLDYESPSEKAHDFSRGMRAIPSCIKAIDMLDTCQEVIHGSMDNQQ